MSYNCEDLKKEDVFLALYNNAKPLGLGMLHFKKNDVTLEEAKELVKNQSRFEYHNGRVMNILFDKYPIINTHGYNQDNTKKAEDILNDLKKNIQTNLSDCYKEITQEQINIESFKINIEPLKIPTYSGYTVSEYEIKTGKKIKQFDKVHFVKIIKDEVPYAHEWFMFMKNEDSDGNYEYIGSVGGRIKVNKNLSIIKSVLPDIF